MFIFCKGVIILPRNKYPEETVQKILETSLRLFVEKGYEKTTVLDIVANLGGLTRGAFYHHFKSKEEVLDAVLKENITENHPFEKAKNAKGLNGLERFRLAMKNALNANVEGKTQTSITQLVISLLATPRFLALKLEGDKESAMLLAPMIEEGMADGSIRPGNPVLLAELFMLLCNFWMFPTIFPCELEVMMQKGEMIEKIFNDLGCPIIDDELGEIFERVMTEVLN